MFTQANTLGLFLGFTAGILVGVLGPVGYDTWIRRRALTALAITRRNLGHAVVLGLVLAAVQFIITLWGYPLPRPVDWVPLLALAVTVGFFEAVFFRGLIQTRLEASFLGSFYRNLRAGGIQMPWEAILGLVDVLGLMFDADWFASRHERRLRTGAPMAGTPNRSPLRFGGENSAQLQQPAIRPGGGGPEREPTRSNVTLHDGTRQI